MSVPNSNFINNPTTKAITIKLLAFATAAVSVLANLLRQGGGLLNQHHPSHRLRSRRDEPKLLCPKKPMGLVSWWNVVLFLITSQFIATVFFLKNHPLSGVGTSGSASSGSADEFVVIDASGRRHRISRTRARAIHGGVDPPDIPPVFSLGGHNNNNNQEAKELRKRLEPFEIDDTRQHRVLYSTPITSRSLAAAAAAAADDASGGADGGDGSKTDEGQGGDEGQEQEEEEVVPQLPLDDYGSRQHMIPKPDDYSGSTPAYLIVGGSDGSGTRAVVNQLVELGALFHVEDKRTMDIHGSEMFHKGGWPPLVNLIMNVTHSANYEFQDLPTRVQKTAIAELTKLKASIDKRAESKLRQQARLQKPTSHFATATHIGWKAPVSMVLMPAVRKVFRHVKFLHVVRDGRDVSLSDNQSPVKKFYNTYYEKSITFSNRNDDETKNNITRYAMQLWNDMNREVRDYGRTHSDGTTFDYLTIRTEDLVNPDTKFTALLQLADFIGSKKTVAELCCLSQREVKDMGKSHKTNMEAKDRAAGRGGGYRGMGIGSKEDFLADSFLYGGPGKYREMMDRFLHHHKRTTTPRDHPVGGGGGPAATTTKYRGHTPILPPNNSKDSHPDSSAQQVLIQQALDEIDTKREAYHQNMKHFEREYNKHPHPIISGLQGMYERRKERAVAKAAARARQLQQQQQQPQPQGDGTKVEEDAAKSKPSKNNNDNNNIVADKEEKNEQRRRLLTAEEAKQIRAMNNGGGGLRPKLRDVLGAAGAGRPQRPGPIRRGGIPGRRDNLVREAPEQVKARYGKWVKALEDKPELSATLHQLGNTGLQAFGYEPTATFLDPPDTTYLEQCKTILEQNVCAGGQPAASTT